MALRQKLENSEPVEKLLAWVLSLYLRFCTRTTRWQSEGLSELKEALREGPVVLVLWHSRIMLIGHHWPSESRRLKAIHDLAPAGRLAGATLVRDGLEPIAMSSKESNVVASRRVLRELREGACVGLAADGPKGPALKVKPATVDWARITGRPVYMFAWAAKRQRKLNTWDRLVLPCPFTRGLYAFRQWSAEVARNASEDARKELRKDLAAELTAFTEDIETRAAAL